MHHAMATRAPATAAGPCCSPHARRCAAPFRQLPHRPCSSSSTTSTPQRSTAVRSIADDERRAGSAHERSHAHSEVDSAHAHALMHVVSRRSFMRHAAAAAAVATATSLWPALLPSPAGAFTPPPAGFRLQVDKLDGYSFVYPDSWLQVTSSGNDIFLRNPRNIDENLFVDMSSPSSSRYESVTDLGTPQDAAARILDQYLTREFMSTRIGIRRQGSILNAVSREGADGRQYYDIAIRMTSYGSSNPYVVTQKEVMNSYGVEWDRVLLTTLGVANKRLYELRFQTAFDTYDKAKPVADKIASSFTVKEVDQTPTIQLPSSLRAL